MPDDPGTDMVKAAAAGGVEGFLRTIAPFVVEAGGWAGDLVRWLRFKTEVKILKRAEALCQEAGISPGAIPLKTFVPLLEYASLEDDPDESGDPAAAEAMQERWAAMIANAAAGDAGPEVSPSFPTILAQLNAPEAAMLDWLSERGHDVDRERVIEAAGIDVSKGPTPGVPNPERERVLVGIENLQRLGLCQVEPPEKGEPGPGGMEFYPAASRSRYWTSVGITRFGRAFVAACTPPTATADPPADY